MCFSKQFFILIGYYYGVHKLSVPREFYTKNALYLDSGNFILVQNAPNKLLT